MKTMLVLRASEDITNEEIANVVSKTRMYGIKEDIETIDSYDKLYDVLHRGKSYDYIYLATHGCETSWGNISGTLNIKWVQFAALVCRSGVANRKCVFLHSCCRGGLNQVAWEMIACCNKIDYVCGPRHSLDPVNLVTAFNLFLFYVEVRKIDPSVAADKVLAAIDVKLVCFDRLETQGDAGYTNHCAVIQPKINEAFQNITQYELKKLSSATTVVIPATTSSSS